MGTPPQAFWDWFRPAWGPMWLPNRRFPDGFFKVLGAPLAQPSGPKGRGGRGGGRGGNSSSHPRPPPHPSPRGRSIGRDAHDDKGPDSRFPPEGGVLGLIRGGNFNFDFDFDLKSSWARVRTRKPLPNSLLKAAASVGGAGGVASVSSRPCTATQGVACSDELRPMTGPP